jgi:hypothetical protein
MKSKASATTTSIATTQKLVDSVSTRYEFSRTMPSTTFATSSQRSVIDSSRS